MNKEKKVIRLGTRKSPLAMAQARLAAEAIERAFPELTAELVPIVTRGDRILDRPLVEFGGKGAFISEFERALLEGRIDGAVHSAKDMPEELAKGLVIAAALPREDAGDVLVTVKGRPLPDGPFLVGTGSPRRQVQIGEMRNARCALLRGNIQTRLNKLREGEYDAILLAAAGLKRMGLLSDPEFSFERLPEKEFIPAGGQGIIAVESREHTEFSHVLGGHQRSCCLPVPGGRAAGIKAPGSRMHRGRGRIQLFRKWQLPHKAHEGDGERDPAPGDLRSA